jgi:membrane-associated phosphatidylinositol transfer protein
VLPLFLSLNNKYKDKLTLFINECNRVYHDFINSQEGSLFNGDVILIGDSIGSILAYDVLALESSYHSNLDSNNSSTSTLESYPSSTSDFEKSLPPTPVHEKPFISLQQHHSFKSETSSRPHISLNDSFIRKSHSLHRLSVFSQSAASLHLLDCLDFKISHFFVFGSPLGLILAYRSYGNLKCKFLS